VIHGESHLSHRVGWLRAGVLGANDGLVSTASLVLGVAAATPERAAILVAGVAGLVAGAMSMGAGEYVSVASQSDAEHASLDLERRELDDDPHAELDELTSIYVERGLDRDLARTVAERLTEHDALRTHARDELGITDATRARPWQAAFVSALSFTVGALLPLLVVALVAQPAGRATAIVASTLVLLAALGALGARLGGARPWRAALRVVFGGGIAMAATAAIGRLVGVAV
jgi:VIT1/CCC1 family predicted Fe2+/Mn2+ transporter